MTSSVMPAFSGRDGPGLMTMPSASRADDLVDRDLVVAHDLHLGAELAEVLVEVVGERVVVVEEEDAQAGAGNVGRPVGASADGWRAVMVDLLKRSGGVRWPRPRRWRPGWRRPSPPPLPTRAPGPSRRRCRRRPGRGRCRPSQDHAADGDGGLDVVGREEADRPAVGPAALALQGGDGLHGADLRCARERAGREHRADGVEGVTVRAAAGPRTSETMCMTCE